MLVAASEYERLTFAVARSSPMECVLLPGRLRLRKRFLRRRASEEIAQDQEALRSAVVAFGLTMRAKDRRVGILILEVITLPALTR